MTVNDHVTLGWRSKCSSSDVNVVGPLKHILLECQKFWRGTPLSSRLGGVQTHNQYV